jgi:hypothetical protein
MDNSKQVTTNTSYSSSEYVALKLQNMEAEGI